MDDSNETLLFDPAKRYLPGDLGAIGTRQTLARWRSQGRGPAYLKVGRRIFYLGSSLNDWLAKKLINPEKE